MDLFLQIGSELNEFHIRSKMSDSFPSNLIQSYQISANHWTFTSRNIIKKGVFGCCLLFVWIAQIIGFRPRRMTFALFDNKDAINS